jgi:UDP-N-acetylmuramate--alanine ligase
MVAHLLRDSGYGCNAFLGGISVNYGTNFWSSDRNVCVIEADEYDRSFLKLSPDVAIITAMDADHLDIYGSAESMEQAFIDFSMRIKPGGLLVSKFGLKKDGKLKVDNHIRYSIQNDASDAYATNIRMMNGSYEFDVRMNDNKLEDVFLHMGGMHNVENAIAAIAVASSLKIENGKIKAAIKNFKGVKRRFEYIIPPSLPGEMGVIRSARESDSGRPVFIDDYAHHPEELKALINGAKTLFSHRNCTIIFQPHLYTRTRDLAVGFAASLDLADEVILLPIYAAREEPIPGITSELILSKMKNKRKQIMNKDELIKWIKENYKQNINREFGAVLITAGAGDIDALVEPIKNILIT